MEIIGNDHLRLSDLPDRSAGWDEIQSFALTFDGYTVHGSFEKCAAIANERRKETLSDLRTCLFFEQRRWRHFGDHPDATAMVYIRSILEEIRTRLSAQK